MIVPPDVVALIVALLMWIVSHATPGVALPTSVRFGVAAVLLMAGAGLIVAARVSFAAHRTTFSPLARAQASELVTDGVYRLTRNPMYLGTFLVLLMAAVLMANVYSAIVSLLFAAYIDRFQIAPEERVLSSRFGQRYADYRARVRRWI